MKKIAGFVFVSMSLVLLLSSCGKSTDETLEKPESVMSEFSWSEQSLLRVQIDPLTLKKLGFAGPSGEGSAEVQESNDPDLVSSFAVETLPEQCTSVASILNGSSELGDELKLSQFSETTSSGNAFFQWVRVFPSTEIASKRVSEFLAAAPKCGVYTFTKSSGESQQFNLWSKIEDLNSSSLIASGNTQYFSVGQVGSAIYFQWLIFEAANLPTKAEMKNRAKELQNAIEVLLRQEQGMS